jgi:DNA-binding transcriptional MerR regulator
VWGCRPFATTSAAISCRRRTGRARATGSTTSTTCTACCFILRAKDLGFTLSEIGDLLNLRVDPRRTAEDVRERALLKIRSTREKVRDLKKIERALQRLVDRCDAHGPAEECALMHAIDHEERSHTEEEVP